VQQMAYYASLGADGTALSPVPGVFQSDAILTADLTAALRAAIAPLEAVPRVQQDWHPGSDEQVLDHACARQGTNCAWYCSAPCSACKRHCAGDARRFCAWQS
jgi:Protein of unknown function (DUF4246)